MIKMRIYLDIHAISSNYYIFATMSFHRFLTYANNVAKLTGRDVVEIMDTMEPLPIGLSWSHFLDVKNGKLKSVDDSRFEEIKDAHLAILAILDQPDDLRLDLYLKHLFKIELSPTKIRVGRFIYTKRIEDWLRKAFDVTPNEGTTDWADMDEDAPLPALPAIDENPTKYRNIHQMLATSLAKKGTVSEINIGTYANEKAIFITTSDPGIWDYINDWCCSFNCIFEYKGDLIHLFPRDDKEMHPCKTPRCFGAAFEGDDFCSRCETNKEAKEEDTIDKTKAAIEDIQNCMTEEEYQTYEGEFDEGMTDEELGVEKAQDELDKTEQIDEEAPAKLHALEETVKERVQGQKSFETATSSSDESCEKPEDVFEPEPVSKSIEKLNELFGEDSESEEEIEVAVRRQSEWEKANPILRDGFLEHDWGKHTAFAKLLTQKVDEGVLYVVAEKKIYTLDEYKKKKGDWVYPEYGVVFTKADKVFLNKLLSYHDSLEDPQLDEDLLHDAVVKMPRWKWLHIKEPGVFEYMDKAVGEAREDTYLVTGPANLVDWAVKYIKAQGNDFFKPISLTKPDKINVKLTAKIYDRIFATPEDKLFDLDTKTYVDQDDLGPNVTGNIVGAWCTKNLKLAKRADQIQYIINTEFIARS